MITNERQLQIAKAQIDRFVDALGALDNGSLNSSGLDPLVKKAQIDAIREQVATLKREVEEYNSLRSGLRSTFDLESLEQLPDGLIRARIAAGLTQKDLADRLGLKEQQIQRYEAQRFEGASFARIVEVANAIGVKIKKQLELVGATSFDAIVKRLASLGVDPTFVKRRIASDLSPTADGVPRLLSRLEGVFGWQPSRVLEGLPLDLASTGGAAARFKMPRGRDTRSAAVYSAYAYHLASVCAGTKTSRSRQSVPADWRDFRREVIRKYGRIDLRSVLSFAWDLNVIVLPLNDPGSFHGACWRINGVNVIVLKQTTKYPARWLFDLLHELRHAGENADAPEFEVVELPETDEARRNSPAEKAAMWFAGQVSLDGKAEELTQKCLRIADNGYLPKLKQAVQRVAASEDVDLGLLANYLAYRLMMSGENWWGAAANLQLIGDPLTEAREVFFERFDFAPVKSADLELLTLALHDGDEDGRSSGA